MGAASVLLVLEAVQAVGGMLDWLRCFLGADDLTFYVSLECLIPFSFLPEESL